jgi:hypothetical protein
LWETPAGEAWLQTLFFATLYMFGLQSHVGANRLVDPVARAKGRDVSNTGLHGAAF